MDQSSLKDTHLMSGAEAYKAARRYYTSVKSATRDNAPGAKVIAEDLGKRFQGQEKQKRQLSNFCVEENKKRGCGPFVVICH